MNELIKELATQADIKFLDFHGREYCEAWVEQQEKFAELIVRECAEQVKNLRVNDYGISGAEIIREHFGVEE
jgi:hypothetical protein